MSTDKTIVLITGATSGLGLEAIKALCQSTRSYVILLAGRSLEKAQQTAKSTQDQFPSSSSTIEALQIDIEDDSSIQQAFELVQNKYGRLDTLLNNAGAQFDPLYDSGNLTMRQAWKKSWNVNVVGGQIMTHTFAPLLLKSADPRLIFMASGTSPLTEHEQRANKNIGRSPAAGWPKTPKVGALELPAYRSSKTGLNMMMREWTRILEEDGVKVWCISPGYLATGIGGDTENLKAHGAGDPAVGGNFMKDVIEGKRDADVGKVIRKDSIQPW